MGVIGYTVMGFEKPITDMGGVFLEASHTRSFAKPFVTTWVRLDFPNVSFILQAALLESAFLGLPKSVYMRLFLLLPKPCNVISSEGR